MKKLIKAGVVAGMLALGAGAANAALVTQTGVNFDIQYDTDNLGLFGAPVLTPDGLGIVFTPLDFKLTSNNQGLVSLNSSTFFDLIPKAGRKVLGAGLLEAGDYYLVNLGANQANVPQVGVTGELRLTNLGNAQSVAQNFSASPVLPLTNVCLSLTGCEASPWAAGTELATPTTWSLATVRVRLENNLLALATEPGDLAFIEKKFIGVILVPSLDNPIVPIPGSVWLFGSALAGMIGWRRKSAV